jgi:peptidyl-Lys metalloendopeptidase
MGKNVRGGFKWMAGWLVSASLVGACGAPADEAQVEVARSSQELSARDVSVRLSSDKATLGAGETVAVTITLTNDSRHPVKLLKWNTPVDGLEEALLEVTLNGEAVAFTGPHYKRPAATEKDFLTLAPGESLSRTVDLGEVYDLSRTGIYGVRFEVASQKLQSNDMTLWVEGRASSKPSDGPVTQLTSSISYTNCTTTQQSTVLQALNAASTMANGASSYLNTTTPSGTPRYTTWFGAYSSSGWGTATSHFTAIKDAFDAKPVTVDCKCKKSYYAYVYPNQPYIIYVCNAFWSAPMTGTDSKGGTLIHEMSHFTVVAGTDDHVYGQSGAKSLAISDPASALDNADSHEYFAENTPSQQ